MDRFFYILAYDISNDKRRTKIAKLMESSGTRVQGSVFEAWFSPKELDKVVQRSKRILVDKEDSLRVYFLCEDCRKKVSLYGKGKVTEKPGLVII
ncbi:CRISPR-associated endonuclease Cas2 [Leptolinea tardivitalis]|uniref:CRISPR-associated endoribonuclease Cas2 n=1 Tax=Leptolinea tardivitalis TaxID=229920 RepID=A0A0N8GL22_9CHLR|nr:CRISPR-associated endonuclease Cas2 [Leptolinea tardivitalis]KPL71290.1 hypothetical protein ADM99_11315 [Leptolinea tardivitalis]GAP23057.1 CRISPR-associated protein, Cas2 family [Leptolinea tardivitalis]